MIEFIYMLICSFSFGVGIGVGVVVGMETTMRLSGKDRTVILTFARTTRTEGE